MEIRGFDDLTRDKKKVGRRRERANEQLVVKLNFLLTRGLYRLGHRRNSNDILALSLSRGESGMAANAWNLSTNTTFAPFLPFG